MAKEISEKPKPKPFGTGVGPTFIGGRDTDNDGTKIALDVYRQYRQYKRIVEKVDEEYYNRWTDQDECVGGCPQNSKCEQGICVCNLLYTQNYGRCFPESIAALSDTDKTKYRIPPPPKRPEWCFCTRDINKTVNGELETETEKFVCFENKDKEDCIIKEIPLEFDHDMQFCSEDAHQQCQEKDINMFCSNLTSNATKDGEEKNLCRCRQDMQFDTKNMECRLYLDVDCSNTEKVDVDNLEVGDDINQQALKDVVEALNDTIPAESNYDPELTNQAFCNLIDRSSEDYAAHTVGELTLFGFSVGGFFFLLFLICIASCCFCQCCATVREKIRMLEPTYALRHYMRANEMDSMAAEL